MSYGVQGDGVIYNINPSMKKQFKIERNNIIIVKIDDVNNPNNFSFEVNGDVKIKATLEHSH